MKIACKFYLPELLVFDSWVTKISVKPVKNSPASKKKKEFQQFSAQHENSKLDYNSTTY